MSMTAAEACHERVRTMLGSYVLDCLAEDERADVEGHLSACGGCRDVESRLRRTATQLRSRRRQSPDLWSRIEELVARRGGIGPLA